jgi:predicted extracellular nuclease
VQAVSATLVINEIDYDQPGTDAAEFIEIKNVSAGSINLDNYTLQLVNGVDGGAAVYQTIDLPNVNLAAGDYFVICGNAATVANCDLDVTPDTNLIQNGAPDGSGVRLSGALVDAVSYEGNTGAPYTEGSGVGLEDDPALTNMGISRCADGVDTDVNNVDLSFRSITPGATNDCPPPPGGFCGDPATFIHDIQGSGLTSPMNGATNVVIEGIVVGDYQGAGQFSGYHVQEEDVDADANPATSEGIFVFNTSFPVSVGDKVRVRGNVFEFTSSGITLTELTSVNNVLICSAGNSVTPATVNFPVNHLDDLEAFEGMLVNLPQQLTVTETFTLGRFGEVTLSAGGRLFNPTSITTPGAAAIAQQDLNNRSRIVLDDGNNQQNIDPTIYPAGGLSASNTLRSGYTVNGLTGVLEQRFGVYRLQPVGPAAFNADNPRPASPASVGGTLKVAAMNVLNYFSTIDAGPDICGPLANLDCRGADSAFEFTRQRDKIISAIIGLNADVIGLMELENNATAAIQDLVSGLNASAGAGAYAFINTGTIGSDAIKVGLIYKPASVTPVGAHAILDSTVDPLFDDAKNRPALAQTFSQNANGQKFTVVVNHLKSKGSDCNDVGDPDTGDGQGNCNITRRNAAIALVNWLATDPTGSGDPDFLIMGDLNSYAMEDPITVIKNAGYTNLIDAFLGSHAYSFVFQAQSGYLDHALSNPSLTPQVTGATEWHINADEPIVLDYNVEFKSANHVNTLYAPGAFRSSDHDPLIVGLCQPPTLSVSASPDSLWPPNHKYKTVQATVNASSDVSTITLASVTSNEPDNGLGDGDTANDIVIVDDFIFKLRAERSGNGTGRVYTITYQVTNTCGATATASATVTVPLNQGDSQP